MDDADRRDWRLYSKGDQGAVEKIYARHRQHLLKYCVYVTKCHETGEEIVQETFLKLMEQKEQLVIQSSLKDWLFICARNLCFNHLSKAKRQDTMVESFTEQLPGVTNELAAFVNRVLGQLSPEERDLILMREQESYTIAEMATLLEISEEAVRVRLYRVRKKMQEIGKEYR